MRFYIVLVLAEGQTILLFHLIAYRIVAEILETVANTFAVIIHAVIDDMAVRMLFVKMTGNDKLGILDSHFLHVFQREIHHKFISHPVCIFRRVGQRDVSAPMSDPAVEMPLTLKTVDNILRSIGQNAFGMQEPCFLSGLIQREGIPYASGKIASFSDASNHGKVVDKEISYPCRVNRATISRA